MRKCLMTSAEIEEYLSRTTILICLVLLRIKENKKKIQKRQKEIFCVDKKFRIAKTVGELILLYGSEKQKKKLIWYRYGVYPIHLERTLNVLLEKGIISEENNRFFLTNKGLSWISERIEPVKSFSTYFNILDEIDICLFTPMPDLVAKMAKLSPHLSYDEQPIGGKKICRVFDWEDFGTGIIEPYHYTLLLSYSYSEKYFKEKYYSEAEKLSEKGESLSPRIVRYSKIPDLINSDRLKKQRKKFSRKILPLIHILDKKDPSYITQIKIEGKNYIANLWYIVESVNIIHVLSGLCPTCGEIARVCLTNYLVDIEGYDSSTKEIRRKRERLIKNDVIKLFEHGILTREKWGKMYVYQIVSRSIYDISVERTYSILDRELVKELYEKKIEPYRQDFRDPFGIEDKILHKKQDK